MTQPVVSQYENRISRVCEYIDQHLDDNLSIAQLSAVAAFSKFHFHRVFSATLGISVTEYIQLTRLKRASFRLVFEPQKRIIDIALEAGFAHPETFSRAFKRHFKQAPSDFRSKPQWQQWTQKFKFPVLKYTEQPMRVHIVDFPTTKVAQLRHRGDPERLMETASRFVQWRKATGLSPLASSSTFGIPHSDPALTDPEEFCWDVCSSIGEDVLPNDYGVVSAEIPGGRCAVLRYKGSHNHQNFNASIYYIYRQWLVENNHEVRDFPCFFRYLNFLHEVDECDLLTDIYVPIK